MIIDGFGSILLQTGFIHPGAEFFGKPFSQLNVDVPGSSILNTMYV